MNFAFINPKFNDFDRCWLLAERILGQLTFLMFVLFIEDYPNMGKISDIVQMLSHLMSELEWRKNYHL